MLIVYRLLAQFPLIPSFYQCNKNYLPFVLNITSEVILDLGLGWWELGAKSLLTLFDFPRKRKSCQSSAVATREYSVNCCERNRRFSK